jgi:hypothetical protein
VALGEKEVRRLTAGQDPDLVLHHDREELTLWSVPADRLPEAALDRRSLAHLQNRADPDLRARKRDPGARQRPSPAGGHHPRAFTGAHLPGR